MKKCKGLYPKWKQHNTLGIIVLHIMAMLGVLSTLGSVAGQLEDKSGVTITSKVIQNTLVNTYSVIVKPVIHKPE